MEAVEIRDAFWVCQCFALGPDMPRTVTAVVVRGDWGVTLRLYESLHGRARGCVGGGLKSVAPAGGFLTRECADIDVVREGGGHRYTTHTFLREHGAWES